MIDGATVESSAYKKISIGGHEKFISYQWIEKIPLSLRVDIAFMTDETPFVVRKFLKKNINFKSLKIYESPQIVIKNLDNPALYWKLTFEEKNGEFTGVYINRQFEVVEINRLGSQFADATAYLYPSGPLKSNLAAVTFQKLVSDGTLRSDAIQVTTQADLIAKAENNQFLYPTHDIRFGQVQVYFYLNQAREWFQENLQFKLPFLILAETFVGFPEKTNTAFYYQQKIRLGEGDGEIFSDITLDPSIIIHESLHAVIQAVAALPYTGEGGSLNEGFADFFTALILKNPKLGEVSYKKGTFKRTIDNEMLRAEVSGGLYHDSGIVSGLLWSLSEKIGADKIKKLGWHILIRLDGNSTFNSFKTEMLEGIETLESSDQVMAKAVLKSRGWL